MTSRAQKAETLARTATTMMDKDWAVLQGAFLLAEKLCLPSTLSVVQKPDWDRVGQPVLKAVQELCRQDEPGAHPTTAASWRKKIVCVLWLKLLCKENAEDVTIAWRNNPVFALQNSLPEINYVVLLEVVKSIAAAQTFAIFLLCLPQSQICAQLEKLVHYVRSTPTREEDVQLFLEVWWELWKHRDDTKTRGQDSLETLFATQVDGLFCVSSSLSPQAAKKLKLGPSDVPALQDTAEDADVLLILLHALKDISDQICTVDCSLKALSISLDALYTTFLIDQEVVLTPNEKMQILSKILGIREKNDEKLSPALIEEALRDLQAAHTPSHFRPSRINLGEALNITTELAQVWQRRGLLETCNTAQLSCSAFKLEQSAQRVMAALQKTEVHDAVNKKILTDLLELLTFPTMESTSELSVRTLALIINHRLDDYENFAAFFASEAVSWAAYDDMWLETLEKNQSAFQQLDTLIQLMSTIMQKLQSPSVTVNQCRKWIRVLADIFSALCLKDKNAALHAMMRQSSKGFFGCSVPSPVTVGFEQELNMAFNCIIQGGAGASAPVSEANANTAVALVARVAFQNPEATLRSCCHSAIFNKGAYSIMAKILQQLPGLRGPTCREDEERKDSEESMDEESGGSLLCRCLLEMITTKLLSANEKEQFIKFVGLLMKPAMTVEEKQSFLPPQEVVNVFVLPHLFNMDVELSLQLLHTALSVDVQEPDSASHWALECSPIPLLYFLAQLHNSTLRCWEQSPEVDSPRWSMETRELLVSVLTTLGQVVGAEVARDQSSWSRALFWLHSKVEKLDWTVAFHLKPVWGEHFKNEVPSSLLTVCDLPEQDWSGLDLPQYSEGTGLLAWMECCSLSDSLQSTMLSHLSVDRCQLNHISMFSKGVLLALTQILPWCSVSQWTRLLRVLENLITSSCLHVPFSLEYVDCLPLLDLRMFSFELRLSVLLLRVLQLLCGSCCSHWLSADGWTHVARLYAHAVKDMMSSVRAKLPLPSSGVSPSSKTAATADSSSSCTSVKSPASSLKSKTLQKEEEGEPAPCQEVLFVLSQLFCHVQHIQVMMPSGECEALFLSALDILGHYEAIMNAFPDSSGPLESDNTRHFFSTITDNLKNREMKAVLLQKIAQLV
ncbi:uncharacterized protein V6R79_000936 [Siganus canaliculatus]